MLGFINSKLIVAALIAGVILFIVCYLQRESLFSVKSDKQSEERLKQVKFGLFFNEDGQFKVDRYRIVVKLGILTMFFWLTYLIYGKL